MYRVFGAFLAVVLAAGLPASLRAEDTTTPDWSALRDGAIVLLRHAEAPGVGDPPGFRLGDCSTQRNLDDQGREQARKIGEAFRRHAVKIGAVLSSQWCRTHETAELAFPGKARDDARFNSFFGDGSKESDRTKSALAALRDWRGPGVLVVVTHQVNITSMTGVVPASGEAVVVQPTTAGLMVTGRLQP